MSELPDHVARFAGRPSRRAAVRLLVVGAVVIPVAWRSPGTRAGRGWCRSDPIVQIGDLSAHVALASDAELDERVSGPTQLVITVPAGLSTRFVAADPGFGHLGYDVRFAASDRLVADDGTVGVQVAAYTPTAPAAAGPLPLALAFTRLGDHRPASEQAQGWTNAWVVLRGNLTAADFATPPLPPTDDTAHGEPKHYRKTSSR